MNQGLLWIRRVTKQYFVHFVQNSHTRCTGLVHYVHDCKRVVMGMLFITSSHKDLFSEDL